MTREQKLLLTIAGLSILMVAGWVAAAGAAFTASNYKHQAETAEDAATQWKGQAGRAYTEMLKARAGGASDKILIPAGARIECKLTTEVADGKSTYSMCRDGMLVYPPKEF